MQTLFNQNSKNDKVALIIGQAPPEKRYEIPFSRTRLFHWLMGIGITKDEAILLFDFDALVDSFPGKKNNMHIIPSDVEIKSNMPALVKKINENDFKAIIPVGKLAIKYILNIEPDLSKVVGREFFLEPFNSNTKPMLIIPLPHPSGLSTWTFKESNKSKLQDALLLIKKLHLLNLR